MAVEKLMQWQSVCQFETSPKQICPKDSADLFCASANKIFREAKLALMFCETVKASQLKMERAEYSDVDCQFELRNGKRLKFQLTEADRVGRRRGDEYRSWKSEGYPRREDPGEQWELRRRAIPDALKRAVQKKVGRYAPSEEVNLLIYLNLGTYGCWVEEVESALISNTEPARGHFRSVWVLWSGRAYRCWPNPFLGNKSSFRPKQLELEGVSKITPLGEILS